MKKKSPKQGANGATRRTMEDWPSAPSIARDDLVIVFHGLLGFCYNETERHCIVAPYGRSNKHTLSIDVVGGTCSDPIPPINQLARNGLHTLALVGGTPEGPGFYKPSPSPFDRLSDPPPNEHDFRWVLDLEGSDFYDEETNKKPDRYRPRLFIKAGTFYTQEKTFSTFKRFNLETGEHDRLLGNIAYCIAANIQIEADQEARLILHKNNGDTVVCRFPHGGGPYGIVFQNTCQEDGVPCRRNDYFHHFASFNPPEGKPPFAVELHEDRSHEGSHSCGNDFVKRSNDEAPCGSAGYGGTPGFPP